jgi:hyperosmotically inducible periplasmic protein
MTTFNFKRNAIALGIAVLSISFNAHALDTNTIQEEQSPYGQSFAALDKDSNNELSKSEAYADKAINAKTFKHADKDADGTLSLDEYAAAKSKADSKHVARIAEDTEITTKAKAKLLAEESLKSLKISVETYKGQVILSGFVSSSALKTRAEEIVSGIEGVKSVKNSIVIKS